MSIFPGSQAVFKILQVLKAKGDFYRERHDSDALTSTKPVAQTLQVLINRADEATVEFITEPTRVTLCAMNDATAVLIKFKEIMKTHVSDGVNAYVPVIVESALVRRIRESHPILTHNEAIDFARYVSEYSDKVTLGDTSEESFIRSRSGMML